MAQLMVWAMDVAEQIAEGASVSGGTFSRFVRVCRVLEVRPEDLVEVAAGQ